MSWGIRGHESITAKEATMDRRVGLAFLLTLAACATFTFTATPARAQGLYGNEGKDKTSGDLDDQDYWWTKWDAKMLEEAIKTRQPEGHIAVNLASAIRRVDDLAKKYPKHEEIKKWKARFEEVDKKIDQNAPRGASFKPGFPWDMANFAQAWVNYGYGKAKFDAGNVNDAIGLYQNVVYNLKIIHDRPELFDTMPEEYKKWAADTYPEAQKTLDEWKKKNH